MPPELRLKIFEYLPMRDLCSVVATSRSFREVADGPNLWAKHDYDMSYAAARSGIRFLTTGRFSTIRAIQLERAGLTTQSAETVLRFVVNSSTVVPLNLSMNDLKGVDPGLLVQALRRLRIVLLGYTKLTTLQCNEIIEELDRREEKIECLNIALNILSKASAEKLGRVVAKTRKCSLDSTWLTPTQSDAIMAEIASRKMDGSTH